VAQPFDGVVIDLDDAIVDEADQAYRFVCHLRLC
jgi:hypothetical protein